MERNANGFPRNQGKDRVRRALRSYANGKVLATNGWFYHFNDIHTGQRWKDVEISTSDSIWLLAGALTCRQYFHEDHEIADLATLLYSRYDFPWMTNGDGKLLSHGLRPEGFIKFRYDKYCQSAAMYLRTLGTHGGAILIRMPLITTSAILCFGRIRFPQPPGEPGIEDGLVR